MPAMAYVAPRMECITLAPSGDNIHPSALQLSKTVIQKVT